MDRITLKMALDTDPWMTVYAGEPDREISVEMRCKDPAPPTHANAKRRQAARAEQKKPAEKSLLAEWVLTNLCSSHMLHISVVPKQDIQRLKGVPNYETYMTQQVRHAMHRDDIRVMVREPNKNEYNATLIFL